MTDWNQHEDAIDDAISDSIDMDWTSRTGAKAVVAWLNENAPYAAPAPSSLAGGEKHYGDPCIRCGVGHDNVPPGPCQGDGITISRERARAVLDYLKNGRGPAGWPTQLWVEVQHFITNIEAALSPQAPAREGEVERLTSLLRNVVAHATGGSVVNGEEMGLNDICCRITQMRNSVFLAGKESALTPRHEAPARNPLDPDAPSEAMIDAGLKVDWSNEDERGTVINVWYAMNAARRHEAPAEGAGERDLAKDVTWAMRSYAEVIATGDADRWAKIEAIIARVRARSSAPEAREGEAVGYANAEFMRRLKNWREGVPNTIRSDETFLNAVASESYPVPLYTHPAAPSADKLRIAVEALEYIDGRKSIAPVWVQQRVRSALAALKAEGA